MSRKTLRQLYAEHTGKVSDKWSLYLTEYDRLFADYRDRPVRLLEIGIQNGGSLEIWSKYFREASILIGCDINPDCARLNYDDSRIGVIVGDANAPDAREQVFQRSPEFDIIIDDGSHLSSDIVRSFTHYFPGIAKGGLFIVEDLHCSYWDRFEGGLFYPYSSISFFKRLADVISHEHWGVPRARADILRGIFTKYGCEVDADTLSQVHSVEFINSMCLVRKAPAVDNVIGHRIVAGSTELVLPGLREQHDSTYRLDPALDQSRNPWTARTTPPDEVLQSTELALAHALQQNAALEQQNATLVQQNATLVQQNATLVQQNATLEQQIVDLRNSRTWRFTAPLRFVAHQIRRVRSVLRATPYLLRVARRVSRKPMKALRLVRRDGWPGIRKRLGIAWSQRNARPPSDRAAYTEWLRRYDNPTVEALAELRQRAEAFALKPLISVLMPVYNSKPEWLQEAIESVRRQTYPHWELCIADDASTDPRVGGILERYAREDARVKVCLREKNGHISAATNSALALASGQFLALLDHDDQLHSLALHYVAEAIAQRPDVGLIFSDEDKVDDKGSRHDPYFKCEFNYELFLAQNMVSHLGVYRHDLVEKLGGFREGFEGSQDYDLALRAIEHLRVDQIVHLPRVLYHWRVLPGSTAMRAEEKPYAVTAARRAIQEHLNRRGIDAKVLPSDVASMYRVRYTLPATLPSVTIIIPTRDRADLLRVCLKSLSRRSTYPNYEVLIIDNGSQEKAAFELFRQLSDERFKVIRDDSPFNFSALNNRAVSMATGAYVCLMNNDIEIVTPEWLEEMLSFAIQKDVGAVGARLWYPDWRLQHGGVLLGIGGIASHSHKFLPRGEHGYFGRAVLHQSFSAVTAACLLIRKSLYTEVGSMDEALRVAFNDVDFCLRVREAGHRNVWTPYAEMIHHESASRGIESTPEQQARFAAEVESMLRRWGDALTSDPAYSPNLTLSREDYALAWPPRLVVA